MFKFRKSYKKKPKAHQFKNNHIMKRKEKKRKEKKIK
jgi:hypothetical protein